MKPTPLLLSLPLTLSFAAGAAQDRRVEPATPAAQVKPSPTFRAAVGLPADAPAAFEFEINGFTYHITLNGNGRRTKGDRTRGFNLRVDGRIERVYFAEYRGDLLLACELDYGDSGAGVVTRLEQPSMRALWSQGIPTYNVGEPLRDGRHLYVTSVGFVAKLDLDTGEYVWEHDKLYGRVGAETFNAFHVPEIGGDAVSFRDRQFYNPAHRVVVHKKTGKIIRVE